MFRFITPAIALLVLAAVSSNAYAVTMPDEGCGDFTLNYDIVAFDPNEKIARKEAHAELADDIAMIQNELNEDCNIASVVTSGEWDGLITYTLHVIIIVVCDCDE